jgi:hypothetical protein
MRYMLLICSDESGYEKMTEAENAELMAAYGRFSEELAASGALVDGARLQPTPTATTVRVRDGETLTTDGPFAETKEQFGGFYTIEAKDLDEALAWAAKVPTATYGSIEVRPLWMTEEEGA